jgi:glycosyltransferase involved in cell wall biosynthesis
MSADRRILYVQYTNPANYPPLQHSARLLAEDGWQVNLMGTRTRGADLRFPEHARISVSQRGAASPGALQKMHYLAYATSVLSEVRRWRPQWVYASDLWSCPIAHAALRFGCRVIYHEHDQPPQQGSVFLRYCLRARRRLARRAAACVLPNEQRLVRFAQEHPEARTMLVWNCPSIAEVQPQRSAPNARKPFILYYHGSIGAPLVPAALFGALRLVPGDVRLRLVGYETAGSTGYSNTLKLQARNFGVEARTEWKGALSRDQLWQQMRDATVGISLVPLRTDEFNLDTLAGASNKTFDYLAAGLALLISDRSDWTEPFGAYGEACDPENAESIASALQALYDDRQSTAERGENGRQRILGDWNYDRQFAPVRELLDA